MEKELEMDNEKCRILCQSPYACRTHKMLRFKKTHEFCGRWGMGKLGDAFQEEMWSPKLDLGHCMRKCDKVFPMEEGIKSAPAPRDRTVTAAPVVMANQGGQGQNSTNVDDEGE